MINNSLRLKYNALERQQLIENSLVTDILKYLNKKFRDILEIF
jgi:hypothetical protein